VDYREAVITDLADGEAALHEANRQLIDLISDLAVENTSLRILYEHELVSRVRGDATIARLRRVLHHYKQQRQRRVAA
jgi:hypothetical protein